MSRADDDGDLFEDDCYDLPPADVWTPEPPSVGNGGGVAALPVELSRPSVEEGDDDAPWQRTANDADGELESCVFMGPPGAGKTTLLGAMCQACMQPPRRSGDHNIKLLPGRDYGRLLRDAHALMYRGEKFAGTQRATPYQFAIRVARPGGWRTPPAKEALFTVRDGPGGALFPRDGKLSSSSHMAKWEQHLISEAAKARTLVLCVDATRKNPWRVAALLPELLGRIAEKSVRLEPPPRETWPQRMARLWRRIREHEPVQRPQEGRWLGADRFLLLLTKVDGLVASATSGWHGRSRAALAASIDPVQQACELLGESTLYQIYTAMHPQAQFAVGVTSAWGFDARSGGVFREGQPIAERSRGERAASDALRAQPNLRDWRPLGLRDAVIFMVSGDIGGTVRQVRPNLLHPQRRLQRVQTDGDHLSSLSRQL